MRRPDPRVTQRRPELSQHFLREGPARALVRGLQFPPGTLVVEPGAGDGALTIALAQRGLSVLAIERDERLYRLLDRRTARYRDVQCVRGDFLATALPSTPYNVVSNVPYGITAALVRKLLHAVRPPDEAVLIVQREAAAKFAGTPRETLFSLLHKPWFEIDVVRQMRRNDFAPAPRVQSDVLRIRRRATALVAPDRAGAYKAFLRATFGHGAGDVSRALRRRLTATQVRRLGRDFGFGAHAAASQLTFAQWLAVFRFVEHECLGHDPTRRVA
jgi:23S rRNA (adenine-N6)-dimethyltransferase